MNLAVVGHVEWVEFIRVERVPKPGEIVHALETVPAGPTRVSMNIPESRLLNGEEGAQLNCSTS